MWQEHQVHIEQGVKDSGVPLCTFSSTITVLCLDGYTSLRYASNSSLHVFCFFGMGMLCIKENSLDFIVNGGSSLERPSNTRLLNLMISIGSKTNHFFQYLFLCFIHTVNFV